MHDALAVVSNEGAELSDQLRRSTLPGLGSWAADHFLPAHLAHRTGRTLGEVAAAPGRDAVMLSELQLGVSAFEVNLQRARRDNEARGEQLRALKPTGDAKLDALRGALAKQRLGMAESFPLGLFTAKYKIDAHLEDLVVTVTFSGDPEGQFQKPEVTLPALRRWAAAPRLSCTCGADVCIHRALALEGLLEQTRTEGRAAARTVRGILHPAWERALAAMAEREDPQALFITLQADRIALSFSKPDARWGSRLELDPYDEPEHFLRRLKGQDRRIAELWWLAARERNDQRWGSPGPLFGDLLLLLEGHPRVYTRWGQPPVAVRVEPVRLVLAEHRSGMELQLFAGKEPLHWPDGHSSSRGDVVVRTRPDETVLYLVSREVKELFHNLGELPFGGPHLWPHLPDEAVPEFLRYLPLLQDGAAVDVPESLRGEEVPSAATVVVRVEGDSVSISAEPLVGGAVFVPGEGSRISASYDGTTRRFARRDFGAEHTAALALARELGLDEGHTRDGFRWPLMGGAASLDLLERVTAFAARGGRVEWKALKPLFGKPIGFPQVSFRIARGKQWFEVEGEVVTEAGRATLAALLEAARERRRWISFGNGAHARIPEEVAEQLRAFASLREGAGQLPLLSLGALPLVEELKAQGVRFDADAEWKRLSERWAQAKEAVVSIPPRFEPVLRDYQKEGFVWMSRLAAWNTGAVLADDMGLGKTVQSLALLASRQALGPALVVAPSSVLHTWKNEAAKFAPELQVRFFHESDRSLGGCGPGSVVVVSWGLFAREAKTFAAQRFATVVLDEAQAIKNGNTQRARATQGLQADFVLALSGTPVENHLGELWSLFRTVVPGLLGSEQGFRARYGAGDDPEGVRALAQVVRPFILRRTKGEVARELPPRTDLNLVVPLTDQERAIYEDVRLAATAELAAVTGEKRRFEMLAALSRLRLAACHPKLVDAGWKGPASKLTRLVELLEELKSSGHRALVFSQFTQHLALVRTALEQHQLQYSYLDGQVQTDERQRRVEAFQAGRGGDVFLISLKAGGTGLTLTAADYVVHLDPWWNPAVEDQASDRAYRIGQTRPVTVYRLIAEGTIEQKILSLHAEKRELVDALLEGTDQVGKLSTEALLELIRRE